MKLTRQTVLFGCLWMSLFASTLAFFLSGVLAYYRPVNTHLVIFLVVYAWMFLIAAGILNINIKVSR